MEDNFETLKGMVTFLNRQRRFGFIRDAGGTDYFFHAAVVFNCEFDDMKEGMQVEFYESVAPKGPKAIGIQVIEGQPKKQ